VPSILQSEEQPSLLNSLPSSHSSLAWFTMPSPQKGSGPPPPVPPVPPDPPSPPAPAWPAGLSSPSPPSPQAKETANRQEKTTDQKNARVLITNLARRRGLSADKSATTLESTAGPGQHANPPSRRQTPFAPL